MFQTTWLCGDRLKPLFPSCFGALRVPSAGGHCRGLPPRPRSPSSLGLSHVESQRNPGPERGKEREGAGAVRKAPPGGLILPAQRHPWLPAAGCRSASWWRSARPGALGEEWPVPVSMPSGATGSGRQGRCPSAGSWGSGGGRGRPGGSGGGRGEHLSGLLRGHLRDSEAGLQSCIRPPVSADDPRVSLA